MYSDRMINDDYRVSCIHTPQDRIPRTIPVYQPTFSGDQRVVCSVVLLLVSLSPTRLPLNSVDREIRECMDRTQFSTHCRLATPCISYHHNSSHNTNLHEKLLFVERQLWAPCRLSGNQLNPAEWSLFPIPIPLSPLLSFITECRRYDTQRLFLRAHHPHQLTSPYRHHH